MTIADVFSNLSAVATGVIGQLSQWITAITGEPILMITFLLPIVGVGIGLLKRLLRVHA